MIDPEKLRPYVQSMNQRAKAKGINGTILIAHLQDVINSSGGTCAWCGKGIVNEAFEIDHIESLDKGGMHHIDNLAVTCISCNRRKSTKSPVKFAHEIYSETGKKTWLIKKLSDEYGLNLKVQRGLFDTPKHDNDEDDIDLDDIPQYKW